MGVNIFRGSHYQVGFAIAYHLGRKEKDDLENHHGIKPLLELLGQGLRFLLPQRMYKLQGQGQGLAALLLLAAQLVDLGLNRTAKTKGVSGPYRPILTRKVMAL